MTTPKGGLIPPSNLVASNVTQTSLQLNWQDNSTNEKWFDIYQSIDGVNWVFYSPSINKNTTVAQVTGLNPGTLYSFKVAAANGSKAAYSTAIMVTTLSPIPVPPKSIDVGDYYVKSYFAVANDSHRTAFLVSDLYKTAVFVVLYDRTGTLNTVPLPNLPGWKANLSGECMWASDTRLVVVTVTMGGMLEVYEYDINGTNVTMVSTFETGDPYSRWVDVIKIGDGTIVVVCYEQAGGIEGWFLHRTPDGTWVDHGRQVMVQSDPLGEPAGLTRLAQRPDGTLWAFSVKDSWSVLNAAEFSLNPFKIITNIQSIIPHSDFGQNVDITINGELPQFFKIAPKDDKLLFLYPTENLISITTPPYAFRIATLALTAWNPDGSITLLENTPGYTERSYANFTLNMVSGNPSICYIPLAYVNGTVPYPLTRFYQGGQQQLLLSSDLTSIVQSRSFNDVVTKNLSGVMQVLLLEG